MRLKPADRISARIDLFDDEIPTCQARSKKNEGRYGVANFAARLPYYQSQALLNEQIYSSYSPYQSTLTAA